MNNHWNKPQQTGEGVIQHHTSGGKLVSGKTSGLIYEEDKNHTNTLKDLDFLVAYLPEDLREYTFGCFSEHQKAIEGVLMLGYKAEELFFRDYLSGPRNEIGGDEIEALKEAFLDVRYELVPTVRFVYKSLENSDDDVNETSSLFIEFHTRGMAF